jgi:hypothetical protein
LAFLCDELRQTWADSLGPSKCDSNPSIGCTGSATVATIVAHIEHIKSIAGVESVGFGADYDGIGVLPADASSVASYPAVVKVPVPRSFYRDKNIRINVAFRRSCERAVGTAPIFSPSPAATSCGCFAPRLPKRALCMFLPCRCHLHRRAEETPPILDPKARL